jgi:hypothetical protein
MSHLLSLTCVTDDSASDPVSIEVAGAGTQLPLLWLAAVDAADIPQSEPSRVAIATDDAIARIQQRAMFLDTILGAGGVVPGYGQLLIDALKVAGAPRVQVNLADAISLDNSLPRRLAVAAQGLAEKNADVSFELPPVKRMNPFTSQEELSPPRLLQGLRAVLQSIADIDRRTRLPTVHRYLTGETLPSEVLRGVELLIGSPVGVNTPWRQVVERRARRKPS